MNEINVALTSNEIDQLIEFLINSNGDEYYFTVDEVETLKSKLYDARERVNNI